MASPFWPSPASIRTSVGNSALIRYDEFQEVFTLVTPVNDVHGAEFYYNAEITPWFHLTADVQVH